jgi:FMN phosphatase YigB (HAD superfamily)
MDRYVVFDLAGVLCEFSQERRVHALAIMSGRSREDVDRLVWRSGLDARAEAGEFTAAEYRARLNETLGTDLSLVDYRAVWAVALTVREDVLAFVRSAPKPKAVFSSSGPFLSAAFDHELKPVADAVDAVVVSWQTGSRQADRVAFEGLGALLGVAPSEIILVDNNMDNVNGARDAGVDAIRYTDVESLRRELRLRHIAVNEPHPSTQSIPAIH